MYPVPYTQLSFDHCTHTASPSMNLSGASSIDSQFISMSSRCAGMRSGFSLSLYAAACAEDSARVSDAGPIPVRVQRQPPEHTSTVHHVRAREKTRTLPVPSGPHACAVSASPLQAAEVPRIHVHWCVYCGQRQATQTHIPDSEAARTWSTSSTSSS